MWFRRIRHPSACASTSPFEPEAVRPPRVEPIRYLPPDPPTPPIRFLDDAAPAPRPDSAPPRDEKAAVVATKPRSKREFPIGTLAFLAVLGGGLVAMRAGGPGLARVEREEEVVRSFAVFDPPEVVVETFNGPVEVTGGESSKVDCLVVKRGVGRDEAAAREELRQVHVNLDRDGGTIRVVARHQGPSSNSAASVRIRVPDGSRVRLRTSNGAIQVAGVEGPVEAHASNGRVEVRDAVGPLILTTTNGPIHGEADAAVLSAETSNGAIEFTGSLAGGRHLVASSNGPVVLKLPEDQTFRVDARASNGRVHCDFGVKAEGRPRPNRLVGSVGDDPRAEVKVRSSNGRIEIEREE